MRKIYFSFLTALAIVFSATNQSSAQCAQNFDAVVAPALPSGWTAVTNIDCVNSNPWVTVNTTSDNAPNSAFVSDPNCVSDEWLNSETFLITSAAAQLTFRNNFNLENTFDGMVLEISIGGGPFADILTAGGSFVTGGYNGTISVNFGSPIAGRQAWTGNSGGFITTTVNLPAAANGQSVVLRFRRGTDSSVAGTGVFIDNITISGCSSASIPCAENFDGVVAPALPAGWVAIPNVVNVASTAWVTNNAASNSAPNSAFTNDPGSVSDEFLHSNSIAIVSAAAQLTFRNNFNLENIFDGMVLEISIGGGPFADILTAGGSFVTGGYNGTISVNFGSPIAGRQAWTGNSGGFIITTVNLPASANGQSIVLRWRRATDTSVAGTGARIDDISITGSSCGACTPPTITSNPVNVYTCAGSNASFTVATSGSAPTYQWQENIAGTFANISNGGVYSGATSQTLTISGVGIALSGRQYRVVVTNPCGNATSSAAVLTINQTTHITATATPNNSMCSPGATTITGTAGGTSSGGNLILAQSGTINLAIPDNSPAGVSTVLNVPSSITAASDLKLRLNMRHSLVGDLRITLTGPCGTTIVFDRPGVPAGATGNTDNLGTSNAATPPPAAYIFDIAGATIIPEASVAAGFIPAGTYQPSDASNPGFAHNWAGLTFPCIAGNWTLTVSDNGAGDLGTLVDWAIFKTNLYTHTLTGPGTIVQNAPTGPNNATGNFSVTAIPAGVHTYVLTSTDGAGCSAVTNLSVTVNPTPVVTIAPVAPVICNGDIQQLTATVAPALPQSVTGGGTVTIGTTSGPANPYPSTLVVTGLPTTGVTIKSVTLNGVSHTFPSDLDILLQSPTGGNVILLSDRGGGTDISNIDLTFDDAAAAIAPSPLVAGTHRPTNTAGPDNFPAPGPGSVNQVNPTLASLGSTSDYNGAWKLFVNDQFNLDGGSITSWSITFNIPVPVTWTAGAGGAGTIFTNPAATTPYVAGTPTILPVYVKPTATTTATVTSYTATATRLGCTGSATVNVTTNALPAITTQPAPATQTICPGFNVVYSVAATGTGLTYQWRKNGVNLVNGVQASGSLVSGATTNSVTLIGVVAADAGSYSVVVSGTCTPAATSANAVLVIGAAPTISTQPTNRTVCEGLPTTFTVAATGTPTPTIYQWQVSTNGGSTWTNLTTGGSYTASFTIPAVTVAMSGNLYRVIVTNSCGQSTTSNSATLTVPAFTPVTATQLPATICLSDGPIALVGSPVGGTWSGIGVSGSNFVPSATAAGTYTLTYTYTNGAGCVSTTTITARVVDAQACGRINLLRDNAVILYPNPNDGRFNIRINSTLYGFLGMQVYSSAGQLVHRQSFTNLVYGQVIPIDLSKLPSGPYMVKFFYDGGARTSEKTFTVVIGRQ